MQQMKKKDAASLALQEPLVHHCLLSYQPDELH
jgi:hypothetical protein